MIGETFSDGTVAKIEFDPEVPRVAILFLNDQMHSSVNLDDESILFFEYAKETSKIIDQISLPGQSIKCLILGAGAYSIPRYIQKTRPGSPQTVVEISKDLIEFVDTYIPFDDKSFTDIVCEDAYDYVFNRENENSKYDFVLFDVYADPYLEDRFISYEFLKKLDSFVSAKGVVAINVIDGPQSGKLLEQIKNIFLVGFFELGIKVLEPATSQGVVAEHRNMILYYKK